MPLRPPAGAGITRLSQLEIDTDLRMKAYKIVLGELGDVELMRVSPDRLGLASGDSLDLSCFADNLFRIGGFSYKALDLEDVEDEPFDMIYAGGYIWIAVASSPGKIVRLDPQDMNIVELTFTNPDEEYPTALAWDGTHLWAQLYTAPTKILRIDPDTLAYEMIEPDDCYGGFCLTFDGTYVWAGFMNAMEGLPPARLARIDPSTMAYDVLLLTEPGMMDPISLAPGAGYAWAGLLNEELDDPGTILRINPSTMSYDILALTDEDRFARGLVFDGTHIWAGMEESVPSRVFKVDPETLVYDRMIFSDETEQELQEMIFDGTHVYALLGVDPGKLVRIDRDTFPDQACYQTFSFKGEDDFPVAMSLVDSSLWVILSMDNPGRLLCNGEILPSGRNKFEPGFVNADLLDLLQGIKLVLENRTSDPDDPAEGRIWLRTDL